MKYDILTSISKVLIELFAFIVCKSLHLLYFIALHKNHFICMDYFNFIKFKFYVILFYYLYRCQLKFGKKKKPAKTHSPPVSAQGQQEPAAHKLLVSASHRIKAPWPIHVRVAGLAGCMIPTLAASHLISAPLEFEILIHVGANFL
jgi:hypothetical protein